MDGKTLFAILAVISLAFATAPIWVASGASLTYSAGTDSIAFNVVSANGSDIKINVVPASTGKTNTATENASADSGQFWYDNALLSSATVGSTVGDFAVVDESAQQFAGKQWNTITLEDTVSGAKTTKVYDKQSGLLLKQSVDSPGAPVITLTQFTIPGISAQPPAQQPAQPPAQQPAQNQTQQNGTAQPAEPQDNATDGTSGEPLISDDGQPSQTEQPAEPAAPAEEKGKCASGFVLLALLGFAAFCRK
jgi:hypothetical protein